MKKWVVALLIIVFAILVPFLPFSFGGTTLGVGTTGSAFVSPSFAVSGCGALYNLQYTSTAFGIPIVGRIFSGYAFSCNFRVSP